GKRSVVLRRIFLHLRNALAVFLKASAVLFRGSAIFRNASASLWKLSAVFRERFVDLLNRPDNLFRGSDDYRKASAVLSKGLDDLRRPYDVIPKVFRGNFEFLLEAMSGDPRRDEDSPRSRQTAKRLNRFDVPSRARVRV